MDQAPLGHHHYQLALKRVSYLGNMCVEGNECIDSYTLTYCVVVEYTSILCSSGVH